MVNKATIEPELKSMPAANITMVDPIAINATMLTCKDKLDRLPGFKKRSVVNATIRATITIATNGPISCVSNIRFTQTPLVAAVSFLQPMHVPDRCALMSQLNSAERQRRAESQRYDHSWPVAHRDQS